MKILSVAILVVMILLVTAAPALAAGGDSTNAGDTKGANSPFYGNAIAAGLGAAITIVGAGIGFGKIGSAALESMARQPETAGQIQTAMLIIAALLEGATFFALIVCILMALKA